MNPQKRSASTAQYWKNYYRTHQESSKDLKEKITLLNLTKKSQDVEAIIKAYLTYHSKDAEPCMYEALALEIKMNKGARRTSRRRLGLRPTWRSGAITQTIS